MRLFVTPASPWVRRVNVTLHELGLFDRVQAVSTRWPHSWSTTTVPFDPAFAAATPVGRIPILVTDDGIALTDSDAICDYLNSEWAQHRLLSTSGQERTRQLAQIALAKAILEAQISRRAESLRQPDERSESFLEKMTQRGLRCFAALDDAAKAFAPAPNLAQITLACACGFADFRFPKDDWRGAAPHAARWYEDFAKRDSMQKTLPAETPQ